MCISHQWLWFTLDMAKKTLGDELYDKKWHESFHESFDEYRDHIAATQFAERKVWFYASSYFAGECEVLVTCYEDAEKMADSESGQTTVQFRQGIKDRIDKLSKQTGATWDQIWFAAGRKTGAPE